MDYADKIARYQEIERRGLLDKLPVEKQEAWAEYKRRQKPALTLNDEQKAQIKANNEAYASRQEANRPWTDKNPGARLGVAMMQGITNAGLNPAGYIARAAGIDTKAFVPATPAERGAELAGQYGFDAAALGGVGKIAKGAGYLGRGKSALSKVAQSILAPESLATFAVAPAAGGGLAEGIANPSTDAGKFVVNMVGAGIPAFMQGALSSTKQTLKTGLKNILSNNKANAAVSKGIKASQNVAQQVADDAPSAYNTLNDEMVEALNSAAGRKLDIDKALKNQNERYKNFIELNANSELVNFAPTKKELAAYPAQSKFNRPKQALTKEKAQEIIKDRAKQADIELGGDINHYTKDSRRTNIVRTLANTLEKPDIVFSHGKNGYVVKKYNTDGEPFFDFIIKKKGGAYNKFPADVNYINNQLKKSAKDVSLSGGLTEPTGAGHIRPAQSDNNNIARQPVVVNENLPRLSDYTKGLDEFQTDALNEALKEGARMSTAPKGSMHATHRAQEVLNDMIDRSYDTSIIGQKKATTETRELMEVKNRLNKILETGGIKPYDAGMQKAKSLQAAYEKGYKFKPSEVKFEHQGLETVRDKRAFLQGVIAKILDNTVSDGGTNLATTIKKNENTLKALMSKKKFDGLMEKANKAATEFERLKSLETQAKNRLVKDTQAGSSIHRENLESIWTMIGRGLDVLGGKLNRRANTDIARQYLGNSDAVVGRGGLLRGLGAAGSSGTRQLMINAMNNYGEN